MVIFDVNALRPAKQGTNECGYSPEFVSVCGEGDTFHPSGHVKNHDLHLGGEIVRFRCFQFWVCSLIVR